ncbi:MAG: hypothetical protein ACE5F4_02745 [Candidatus Paceibacteria bacterium]
MQLLKNKILWWFVISIILSGVGFYLLRVYDCGYSISCYHLFTVTAPKVFYPSLALAFVFFILLFIPSAVRVWRTFAVWYIPIVGFVIAFSSPSNAGWKIGPDYHQYIQFFSAVYIIGSLVAVFGSRWAARTGKKIPWFFSATFIVLTLIILGFAGLIGYLFYTSP